MPLTEQGWIGKSDRGVRKRRNGVGLGEGKSDVTLYSQWGKSVKAHFHITWSSANLIQIKMSVKCESRGASTLLYRGGDQIAQSERS